MDQSTVEINSSDVGTMPPELEVEKPAIPVVIYTYDHRYVYTGSAEFDPMGEVPVGLMEAPPALTGTQVAQAQNGKWVVLASAPIIKREVPQVIPMLNAHLVLIDAGWMPGIQQYIDSLSAKEKAKANAYLQKALTMRRDHPLVQGIPAIMNKTEAQVDELFQLAYDLG